MKKKVNVYYEEPIHTHPQREHDLKLDSGHVIVDKATFNRLVHLEEQSKTIKKRKEKDERQADFRLQQLGVRPRIYLFEAAVSPFTAITIAEDCFSRESVRARLNHILSNILPALPHEKATRLRKELAQENIYGVAICDQRDTLNLQRGRTIAKGRLWKHLKQEAEK